MIKTPLPFVPRIVAKFAGRDPEVAAPSSISTSEPKRRIEPQAAAAAPELKHTSPNVQGIVLEYADTLQRLCKSLSNETTLTQQPLEQQIHEARTALAMARAALIGTRVEQMRARHAEMHDRLTALPNRRFLMERLDRALADTQLPQQALAVLHLNFGYGQTLQDSRGHDCNDALVKIVAARLHRSLRAEDMVCRLDGDEFACLLPGLPGRESISRLATTLFDVVSAPLRIGNLEISLRPSVGIAVFPNDGKTAEALLKSADSAMRFAKRQRTCYAFFDRHSNGQQYGFTDSSRR